MKKKTRIVLTTLFTITGLCMIGSGLYLELATPIKNTPSTEETNPDIALKQTLSITLKDLHLTTNEAFSMDLQNYIEEPVEAAILQNLILDTSQVDISKAGVYHYTITYQDQVFEGTITVEEKQEENTEPASDVVSETITKLTLKNISLKLGTPLSKDISDYVSETLTEEVKQQIKLDTSTVNVKKAGVYQYTIHYNGMLYTGTISIIEDQPTSSTTPEKEKEEEKKEETETPEQTNPENKENP